VKPVKLRSALWKMELKLYHALILLGIISSANAQYLDGVFHHWWIGVLMTGIGLVLLYDDRKDVGLPWTQQLNTALYPREKTGGDEQNG